MVENKSRTLDRTFSALAHPLRRDLMNRLARAPATVTELAEPYSVSLAAVSKHIKVLEAAGLVERQVEGREHHIHYRPEPLHRATSWFLEHQRFWQESLRALQQLADEGGR